LGARERGEGFLAVACDLHLKALCFQEVAYHVHNFGLVVDDQHPRRARPGAHPCSARRMIAVRHGLRVRNVLKAGAHPGTSLRPPA
jgi:hypothetical protein